MNLRILSLLGLGLGALLASGCLDVAAGRCGELLCPRGTVCAQEAGRCVTPDLLSACADQEESSPCTLAGVASAECSRGVCTAIVCGDGAVRGAEACDDGNNVACDGCSADCRVEKCGDAVVECGEQCDLGAANSLAPNAACRPDCRRQRCGDGVVDDRSGETCDGAPPAEETCEGFGFYGGELRCSATCRADTATCVGICGDGQVNGSEICDGVLSQPQSCLDFDYDVGTVYCGQVCTPSFAGCERMWFAPLRTPEPLTLYALWASGPLERLGVGASGAIFRFDGSGWTAQVSGTDQPLYGVWGSAPGDVWAVGDEGTLLHFDGTAWASREAGTTVQLNAVWGSGPQDVFVVGREGTVLHFDGAAWTPMVSGLDVSLTSVWGSGPKDVFATSSYGHVIHYDGTAWSQMTLPLDPAAETYLYSVWGTGPKDVFVVGDLGTVLHYDGAAWTQMASGTTEFVNVVAGTGPKDVFAGAENGVVVHYDGVAWSIFPSGTQQAIYALSPGPDDVLAAGDGVVLQFLAGGPTVSEVATGLPGGVDALWASGPDDVFAADDTGAIARFDGTRWTVQVPTSEGSFSAMWGTGPTDVFAVGTSNTVMHYDGTAWTAMGVADGVDFNWVWGSGPTDVWAVGWDADDAGILAHYDGASWSVVPTGPLAQLYGVWGSAKDDVWACGEEGTLLHFDGSGWSTVDPGFDGTIWGVWGSGPDDVFAFADLDGVLHWDGRTWSKLNVRSKNSFDYASGTGPTDAFVVEYEGSALLHYDGIDFAPLRLPAGVTVSTWMGRGFGYVGMQEDGRLLKIDRHCTAHERRCGDRWDNDCDGLLNCADEDCQGSPACAAGGHCAPAIALACGGPVKGSTAGGAPVLERYSCAPRPLNGRERIYRLSPAAGGEVAVRLANAAPGLQLVVVGAFPSGGCDLRGRCLAASGEAGSATFTAVAGATYYVIVDGADDAMGSFELEVTCP